MTNTEALRFFLAGANIFSLAVVAGETQEAFEQRLRAELVELARQAAAPPVAAPPATAPETNGHIRPKMKRWGSVETKVGPPLRTKADVPLSYPEGLRDARAATSRAIWDCLDEEHELSELVPLVSRKLGRDGDMEISAVSATLYRLRQEGLIEKSDDRPPKWGRR